MEMKKLILVALAAAMTGCITRKQQVDISASYAWEHRYTSADEVVVNGEKIQVAEDGSYWILSNVTLKNLIKQTANSAYLKSFDPGSAAK